MTSVHTIYLSSSEETERNDWIKAISLAMVEEVKGNTKFIYTTVLPDDITEGKPFKKYRLYFSSKSTTNQLYRIKNPK